MRGIIELYCGVLGICIIGVLYFLKSQFEFKFKFKKSENLFLNIIYVIFPAFTLKESDIKSVGVLNSVCSFCYLIYQWRDTIFNSTTDFWIRILAIVSILIVNWVIYAYMRALEILYEYITANKVKLWVGLIIIQILCIVAEQMIDFDKGVLSEKILNGEMILLYIIELICIWKLMIDIVINKDKVLDKEESNKNDKNKLIVIALLISIQITYFISIIYSVVGRYPGAFSIGDNNIESFVDVVYFVIVTYTTLGYGDILPTTYLAKIVVCIISITSFVTNIIVIGEIISVYNSNGQNAENTDENKEKDNKNEG